MPPSDLELDTRRARDVQWERTAGALDDTGLGHSDHTCHIQNISHTSSRDRG